MGPRKLKGYDRQQIDWTWYRIFKVITKGCWGATHACNEKFIIGFAGYPSQAHRLPKRKNVNSRSLLANNRLQAKTSEVQASCYFQGSITDLYAVAIYVFWGRDDWILGWPRRAPLDPDCFDCFLFETTTRKWWLGTSLALWRVLIKKKWPDIGYLVGKLMDRKY